MNPWEWVAVYAVTVLITLIGMFFGIVILSTKDDPPKPTPCPRCGHTPGTETGPWRKPS